MNLYLNRAVADIDESSYEPRYNSLLGAFNLASAAIKPHGYPFEQSANPHWVKPPSPDQLTHIPGESGLPIIGNTLTVLRDPIAAGRLMFEKYGSVYRNNVFGGWSVNLLGADANELVMFNKDKIFSSEQGWGPVLNNLFPRGRMLMDADRHRSDRRALSVAFKPGPMRHHCKVLNEGIAEKVAQELEDYPEQDVRHLAELKAILDEEGSNYAS